MERNKLNILFLCTGNSCRSQMAEGFCRHLKGDRIDAYSAGIEAHGLNALAVKAMSQRGIDISFQQSQRVSELSQIRFDHVVTVCGHADEICPTFSGECKVSHIGFDDPPALAQHASCEAEAMPHYLRVCDEIAEFVTTLPESLA